MRISLLVSAALLPLALAGLPTAVQSQTYPPFHSQRPSPAGASQPFGTPQIGQVPLLGTLDIGGLVQPNQQTMPPGCIYGGQLYSEGAVVRNAGGRQVCVQPFDAVPDASGQVPLVWRSLAGN